MEFSGLSHHDAQRRREMYGENELRVGKIIGNWDFLIVQFKNPLVIVLLCAALVVMFLGYWKDFVMIMGAIGVNVTLGFFQERRAFRALESLKKVLALESWVLRDGQKVKLDSRLLVPGDVVWVYEGDKVPADIILMVSNSLRVNESMLTGESELVVKSSGAISTLDKKYADEQMIFAGTVVMAGSGKGVVRSIGMATEVGKIAVSLDAVQVDKTPLEKRLSRLSLWITGVVLVIASLVFAYGIFHGKPFFEMLLIAVALAVAAIPEGLVIALTVILAIGMQRILAKKAVVRTLIAAETLGSVTVVCVDKTGTLTEGLMQVVDTWWKDKDWGYKAAILANDRQDANELARWEWALEQAADTLSLPAPEQLLKEYPRDDVLPFSSDRRFLVVRSGCTLWWAGSPELLIHDRAKTPGVISEWGEQGRRMIGLGYVTLQSVEDAKQYFNSLATIDFSLTSFTLLGIMAFADPVRKGVKEALKNARVAGVQVTVITGDMRPTALAVMSQLGISPKEGEILEGWQLEGMSESELHAVVPRIRLFARTKPAQKLAIVQALKSHGAVVAMMGDGINDSPALSAADIGIVVSGATEVAKESADIVLLDSNFGTILDAIEEGRGIYANLQKIIVFLLGTAFAEVVVVVGGMFMGWGTTLMAAQILWINLIADSLPYMSLTIDPKNRDLLKRKPIDPATSLLDGRVFALMGVISLVTGVLSLWLFYHLGGEAYASTGVFVAISIASLMYVMSCRSVSNSILHSPPWRNGWLMLAILLGIFLTLLAVYVPLLQDLLSTKPLLFHHWVYILGIAMVVLISAELVKWRWRP